MAGVHLNLPYNGRSALLPERDRRVWAQVTVADFWPSDGMSVPVQLPDCRRERSGLLCGSSQALDRPIYRANLRGIGNRFAAVISFALKRPSRNWWKNSGRAMATRTERRLWTKPLARRTLPRMANPALWE